MAYSFNPFTGAFDNIPSTVNTSKFVQLEETISLGNLDVKISDVSNPRTGNQTPGYWIFVKPTDNQATQYYWSIIETPYIEALFNNNTVSIIGATNTSTWFGPGGSGDTFTPNPITDPYPTGLFIEQQGAIASVIITDKTNLQCYRITWQVLGYATEEIPIFPITIEKLI